MHQHTVAAPAGATRFSKLAAPLIEILSERAAWAPQAEHEQLRVVIRALRSLCTTCEQGGMVGAAN